MNPLVPKISIVTPSYNQAEYLETTIKSVLQQNYPNLEYIIIDGGSTDGSVDIIKKYEKYLHYWISEPDNGQTDAINKGFCMATGDILTWIASDDYFEKGSLNYVAEYYSSSGFDLLNGNCYILEDGKVTGSVDSGEVDLERLIKFWKPYFLPPQPSIFFTKEVWQACGPLDEGLVYSMDLQLWLEASLKFEFTHVKEYLSYYRFHSKSKSGSDNGFNKFIPEWEKVVLDFVNRNLNNIQKLKFLKEYTFYKARPSNKLQHGLSILKSAGKFYLSKLLLLEIFYMLR